MNKKINKKRSLLSALMMCIIIGLTCVCSYADSSDPLQESIIDSIPRVSALSEDEQAFYTMMIEYWIPDLYEIKGGMQIALRASTGFDELFKAACHGGITRLEANIAEMNQYKLSESIAPLRTAYVLYTQDILTILSQAENVDQTQSEWVSTVEKSMSALSMYASWLHYHVIEAFSSSQIASQDYASLSADTFMQVVKQITG